MARYLLGLVACLAMACHATAESWDVHADTWGAVDALGRELPGYDEVGPPRSDRYVGIFYFLWLGYHTTTGPWDITKILAANPSDPQWGPVHHFHHWGESERGYYVSDDDYVIRKHAQELSDAGVDTLIFDVTNAFTYKDTYVELCRIYTDIRDHGGTTPQICFITHSSSGATAQTLYNDLYSKNLYSDLWFRWLGKPLLLADPYELSQQLKSYFTVRESWAWSNPGGWFGNGQDKWPWLDNYPQNYGWHVAGVPEEVAVCVAQHPTTNIGRSFHNGSEPAVKQTARGLCFAEQLERALAIDPQFMYITGWNEWTAQRFISDGSTSMAGSPVPAGGTYFVDLYSQEYSRDIEPMKGGYTDNYYYQMCAAIRRYKGVRQLEQARASGAIQIDGTFSDWTSVVPEYRDQRQDTFHRNHPKWGGAETYTNTTGRNDIIAAKTAVGSDYVYFYVRCEEDITAWTDDHWMMLYIDTDQDTSTGWNGYDLLLNRDVVSETNTRVERHLASWFWSTAATAEYRVVGAEMELAVPRSMFGNSLDYAFKWTDNVQDEGATISFSLTGDAAPNRRAQYLVRAIESVPPLVSYHSADTNENFQIDTSELLYAIHLYKLGAYHCDTETDGYAPGSGDTTCASHNSDYAPQDWSISLSELLRLVQFVNAGGYQDCRDADPAQEDDFCPGPAE